MKELKIGFELKVVIFCLVVTGLAYFGTYLVPSFAFALTWVWQVGIIITLITIGWMVFRLLFIRKKDFGKE